MAGRETVFGDSEKIHLLTEIIRSSIARPEDLTLEILPRLLEIVNRYAPEPRWYNIVPPAGRNILACQRALDLMRQFTPSNVPLTPYEPRPDFPRPVPYDPSVPGPQLAPRPPGYPGSREGYASPYSIVGPPEPMSGRKKRGRPSNREKEELARKAAATGQPLPAPRPPRPPKRNRPSLPPASSTPLQPPILTPVSGAPSGSKPFEDFIPGIPQPRSPRKQPDRPPDRPAHSAESSSVMGSGFTMAGALDPRSESRTESRDPQHPKPQPVEPQIEPRDIRPSKILEMQAEARPVPPFETRYEPRIDLQPEKRPDLMSRHVDEPPRTRAGSVPPPTLPDLRQPPQPRSRTKSPRPDDQMQRQSHAH